MNGITVLSVNVSTRKGTVKKAVGEAVVSMSGLEGDAHSGDWSRQVSLLDSESVTAFSKSSGLALAPGDFGENITTAGFDLASLRPGDRLEGADGPVLVVTRIGKDCHGDRCGIFARTGNCVMPMRGVFCRVEKPGVLRRGAVLSVHPF